MSDPRMLYGWASRRHPLIISRIRHKRSAVTSRNAPLSERLTKYRDGAALAAGLAYALGYASRALHAFDFNFGALPGARFEYVVAGILLLLPASGLALFLWLLYVAALKVKNWSERNVKRSRRIQNYVLAPLLGVCLLLVGFGVLPPHMQGAAGAALVVFIIAGTLLAAGTCEPVATRPTSRAATGHTTRLSLLSQAFATVGSYFVVVYFATLLASAFLVAAFAGAYILRFVPQELGGVKPKCAILDIATDQVSPEIAALLTDRTPQAEAAARLVRSQPLDVFSTSGPWLVRVPGSASTKGMRSIRLPEQAVRSVEWVSNATPAAPASNGCSSF